MMMYLLVSITSPSEFAIIGCTNSRAKGLSERVVIKDGELIFTVEGRERTGSGQLILVSLLKKPLKNLLVFKEKEEKKTEQNLFPNSLEYSRA